LIAKRCREGTTSLFNIFEAHKQKIRNIPTDIEKLTELKEYMTNLPQELDKLRE